jgi:hypothetical protein
MTTDTLHPLAAQYLERLRRAGRGLPPGRLRELLAEIEGHLSEAIGPSASDAQALTVLDRLGEPEAIIAAETPDPDAFADRRGPREWAAIILLLFGGFIFGFGWFAGLILLWSSRAWTTRDKWIGTLVVPGGLAASVLIGQFALGAARNLQRHRRRRTALHQRRGTEHRLEHSRSRRLRVSRTGSDRDLGLSRAPRWTHQDTDGTPRSAMSTSHSTAHRLSSATSRLSVGKPAADCSWVTTRLLGLLERRRVGVVSRSDP